MNNPIIYFLLGDTYLAEEQFQKILREIRKRHGEDTPCQQVHLSDTPFEQILSQARTLPFLVSAQAFRLRDAEILKGPALEILENYLARPTENSYLIFETGFPEKGQALSKVLEGKAQILLMEDSGKRSASARLIQEKLRRAGKNISPDAMQFLEEKVGDEPVFLQSLLDQIILYAGDQKEISLEMVEAFEENWKEADVFKFLDALIQRRYTESWELAEQFMQENEQDLISLVGLLHWQLRRLWLARVMMTKGESEQNVFRKCRISPRQAPFFLRQVKSISLPKLETLIEKLFQMDWKIKTGALEPVIAMETWLAVATAASN